MSVATLQSTDVINRILGVEETGSIATLRHQKPELAAQLQTYYDALFDPNPDSTAAFPLVDRYLIAVRVASHTRSAAVVTWYADLARSAGVPDDTITRLQDIATPSTDQTPFGAAVRHADLLTTRPADARAADLQALKDAGITPAGILSLSQVIAFVSYQLRLIAGLRALGEQS